MPFFDIQKKLGIDLDRWLTIQSAEQPHKIPSRCHAFEKEWIECSHGIGGIRARKECQIEYEDLLECLLRQKTVRKWWRWELSYFLISLGLLFSIFNWSLSWIGKTFYGETPLFRYHVKEVKCLQILGRPVVPQCSSSSLRFSLVSNLAIALRLEITCLCLFLFL